jgi:hypothetical protein
MHGLAARALPRTRPERALLDQIDGLAEQVCKLVLNADQVQQRQTAGVVKRRQRVDIRIRPRLIPRRRPEQRKPGDPDGSQLRFMRAQRGDNLIPFHARKFSTPS